MADTTIDLDEAQTFAIQSVTGQVNELIGRREAMIRSIIAGRGLPANSAFEINEGGQLVVSNGVGRADEPGDTDQA